jgi:hypothetical protein
VNSAIRLRSALEFRNGSTVGFLLERVWEYLSKLRVLDATGFYIRARAAPARLLSFTARHMFDYPCAGGYREQSASQCVGGHVMERYRILSLDGGGSWALIQVKALIELFGLDTPGREVLQNFNLVAANSGGSIVLGCLVEDMN